MKKRRHITKSELISIILEEYGSKPLYIEENDLDDFLCEEEQTLFLRPYNTFFDDNSVESSYPAEEFKWTI